MLLELYAHRHPATVGLLRFFEFGHLPEHLQAVAEPCARLAYRTVDALPDGPELSAGLRKLLEAKDCFVRQALPPIEHTEPATPQEGT